MLYGPAWSEGKVDLLDTIMDEDHEQCDVIWQPGNVGRGRRLMQRGIATFRLSYPDLRFEVLAASCCESAVLVHWEASGTNTGPMKDRPATGDPVRFSGMSKLNFNSDGMIKRSEVYRVAPEHERLYFQSRMAKSAAEKPE